MAEPIPDTLASTTILLQDMKKQRRKQFYHSLIIELELSVTDNAPMALSMKTAVLLQPDSQLGDSKRFMFPYSG